MSLEILEAHDRIEVIKTLLTEFAGQLGFDLAFQNFAEECAGLPGKYAPPRGRLLLARYGGVDAGCIALRHHDDERCEMKRLFVRARFRGLGIGRALVERLLDEARSVPYREMILDSHTSLDRSLVLYRKLGFREIPPYYTNPHGNAVYLGKTLDDTGGRS